MGVFSGPDISESGLVFSLDAGNSKSFDNTENLLTNSSSTAAWAAGTFTTETANRILGLHTVRITDLTTDGDSPNLGGTSISPGTYTVSHYIDTINSTSTSVILYIFTFHALNSGFTLSNANAAFTLSSKTFSSIAYSGPAWSNASVSAVNVGNGIYRISITATTSLAGTGINAYMTPFPQNTSYLLVAGSQYESGSTPSNYYATTGTAKRRGTTIADLIGTNNGTFTNGPTYSSANGGSISFGGTDDYVNLGSFFNYQTFTIELWVNPGTTQTTYADIFDNNHTGTQNFVLQQNANDLNNYAFGVNDGSGSISATGTIVLTANTWTHLAFTFSSSTRVIAYVNGVFHSQGNLAGGRTINYVSPNLSLGRWSYGNSRFWNGKMSSFKSYNRILTASEIQQNFNALRGRFGI